MKLRNKKTGEIVELVGEIKRSDGKPDFTLDSYKTLAELNEAVEDYEEPEIDIIDFSNVRLPVVEIHRKVRDCSNKKADLIISLDQKTGVLTYRVVNKKLGYDFVYTPLEFSYVAWTIMEEEE